ncbi:MAG: hypothetical protein U9Q19_08910 [Pseudomonadota bacterium]|nr:hypothetical protein [Pseudomonadota bacterium]
MKNSNMNNVFSKSINALAGAGLILLTTALPASADENVTLHGKSIGELSAGWWQWQEANYPDFSFGEGIVDCSLGQSGPVWYLGGTGGGSAVRECDAPIKGHKHLMFPLVNANMFNPDDWCDSVTGDPDCTVEEKREILDGIFSEEPAGIFNSTACLLQAEVDGVPAVYSTSIVRTQSPPHEYGEDVESVADGVWVILPPLSSGDRVIHFSGGICDIDTGDVLFSVDVIYDLTVK